MARTKASVGAKVSYGKSSKAQKSSNPTTTTSTPGKSKSSKQSWTGGNSYCPRETPNWQLPITRFFMGGIEATSNGESPGTSYNRSKANENESHANLVNEDEIDIQSDDLSENTSGNIHSKKDINDQDISFDGEPELLPLIDDESSHKIGEYFQIEKTNETKDSSLWGEKKVKNKGKGKGKHPMIEVNSSPDRPLNIKNVNNNDNINGKENLQPARVLIVDPKGLEKRSSEDSPEFENKSKKIKINGHI